MISADLIILTDEDPAPEVELDNEGHGWVRFNWGGIKVVFAGTPDSIRATLNGASDALIDAELRRAREFPPLFDDEFFVYAEPCLHPSVADGACLGCGEEVPF